MHRRFGSKMELAKPLFPKYFVDGYIPAPVQGDD